jgi:FAD/FMN-containing dehydrogenase/Fe-S oxidoreductase
MPQYDVDGLARRLRSELRGTVESTPGARALYAADASNYRVVPDLVVTPADVEDLAAAVACCAQAGAPITVRGGGTSMAGNAVGSVVVDTSRHLTTILDLDPAARTAVVEPGVVLTKLLAAAAPYRLGFGADPASASRATLGGMVANNSCGAHSVAWGTTSDNLLALDVVLADGARLSLDAPPAGAPPQARAADLTRRPGREGALHRALLWLADEHATTIGRRFGTFSRQVSGYALEHLLPANGHHVARLLCGSEGTLATTLRATVALTPLPAATVLLTLGFPDAIAAADAAPHLLPHHPLTVESVGATLLDRLPDQVRRQAGAAGLPPGETWLLVELGGADTQQCRLAAATVVAALGDAGVLATSSVVTERASQAVIWRCRRDAAGLATRRADGSEAWGGWEDAAVPPVHLGSYLRGLDELLRRHGLSGASYGHFGEGCLHQRLDFDFGSSRGIRAYRAFVEEAATLVISFGGSVSGEHGDGRARSELLRRMYGVEALAIFTEVKKAFDPTGVMNPHLIVEPAPLDEALRPARKPERQVVVPFFGYRDDGGSFAVAQRRCVGIGKCRQTSGGVMCPSFQVTREEKHSTRGRARLLWEMLDGSVVTDGWRSAEVLDALDLCLSCKGCLSDCPVNVDMATYKAEFTAHYYARRQWARPRSHLSMGWLPWWLRLASRTPGPANRLAASASVGAALKRLGGVAPQRQLPVLAGTTFAAWFAKRESPSGQHRPGQHRPRQQRPGQNRDGQNRDGQNRDGQNREGPAGAAGREVLLWPDTFTNYLSPEVGRAAVEVLEDAGLRVRLPAGSVCCGLTLVSTGQLAMARRVLRRSLAVIGPMVDAGVPIVGLEPSCTAMLQHDAPGLLPDDPPAAAVGRSTYTLAAALAELAPGWRPQFLGGTALVQTHCHQHAVGGTAADLAVLAAAGVEAEFPDAGCCGLAGNFGFEAQHYATSLAIGERALMPRVRAAGPDTVLLADGYSCRTQIRDCTGREPLHLAQLLASPLPRIAGKCTSDGGP